MSNDYLKSFYELGYTHTELEELLSKISNGELLTKEQYDLLMNTIDIIKGITTFNGTYESLPDKPDIINVVKQSNEFISFDAFDSRARTIQVSLELMLQELISELRFDLEQSKADINHTHDDRYALLNHNHEGEYATKNEIKNFVTKSYLDSIIANLGPGSGGGGGSIYPIYVQPTLSIKSSASYLSHKKETTVTITPSYSQNDAGKIKRVVLKKNNEIMYDSTEVRQYIETISLKHLEKAIYTITVEYEDGIIKNTTEGDPYPNTSIKAGTITQSVSIQGIANSYYGVIENKQFNVSDISSLTSIANTSKNFTTTFNLDDQKSIYMYPNSLGNLSSIKDANNFEYINSYTLLTIDYDDVSYNVYVLTDSVSMDVGFKQVFS